MCSRALSTAALGSGADLFRCPDEGARIIEGGDSRIGKRDVGHEEANLHAGNDALVEPNIDVVVVMHNQSTGSDSDEDRFNLAFLTSVNDHALRGRDTPKTSDCSRVRMNITIHAGTRSPGSCMSAMSVTRR